MNRRLRTSVRIVGLCLIALLAAPPSASPQFAVIDVANLGQNILQVLRAIEQIRYQIDQLETMYKNLERIGDPSWRDLRGYVLYLNELARQGESLAYSTENLFTRFREVLVGYVPMEPELYGETYGVWITTALDTLAATLDSVSEQSRDYLATQEQIAELQALADSADGGLEALNVSSMLQAHVAQEVAKLNQMLAASVNAQNVAWGLEFTLRANHEATERWLIEESLGPFHVYDGEGGFTGIPGDWPYACFGCAG